MNNTTIITFAREEASVMRRVRRAQRRNESCATARIEAVMSRFDDPEFDE